MRKLIVRSVIIIVLLIIMVAGVSSWAIYRALTKASRRVTHALYQRKRSIYSQYLSSKHQPEEITMTSADGLRIAGLLLVRPNAKRVIILCHGYRQAKEFLAPFADIFTHDTLLLLDFRAHGSSQGEVISWGYKEAQDIAAAVRFVQQDSRTRDLPLYGLALSMGTAALVKAATEVTGFKALVLDSGFAALQAQVHKRFNRATGLPQGLAGLTSTVLNYLGLRVFARVDTCELINQLTIPVLIIHSTSDKTVPLNDALTLYACARAPKELWLVKDARHVRIHVHYAQEYKERVLSFFQAH